MSRIGIPILLVFLAALIMGAFLLYLRPVEPVLKPDSLASWKALFSDSADLPPIPIPDDVRARSLELLCVKAETLEPLADVEVFAFSRAMIPEAGWTWGYPPIEVLRRFAYRFRSDAEGKVMTPSSDDCPFIVAVRGDLYGADFVLGGPHARTFVLKPAPHIPVRVLDDQDRPLAHAPVALRWSLSSGAYDRDTFWTDERGDAEVIVLEPSSRSLTLAFVALQGVFGQPVEVAVDPFDPPKEPLVLRAPRLGTAELRIKAPPGQEAQLRDLSVELRPCSAFVLAYPRPPLRLWPDDGLARTNMIEVGLTYKLRVVPAPRTALGEVELLGERIDRQAGRGFVAIELPPRPKCSALMGRLLARDGEPLRSLSFDLQGRLGSSIQDGTQGVEFHRIVVTDDLGRFRLALDAPPRAEDHWLLQASRRSGDLPEESVTFEFWNRDGPEQDLGDLTLRPLTTLAAGVLRAADGREVAQAVIRIREDREGAPLLAESRTGADGRFELMAMEGKGRLILEVAAEGFELESLPVSCGVRDLQVELTSLARLQAELARGDGSRAYGLVSCLVREGTEDDDEMSRGRDITRAGRLDRQTRAGKYLLRIFPSGRPTEILFEKRELQVGRGEVVDLGRIEVGNYRYGMAVRLSCPRGEEVDYAWCRIFRPGSRLCTEERIVPKIEGNVARFTVPFLPADIEFDIAGFRTVKRRIDYPFATVELDNGHQVRVVLEGLVNLKVASVVAVTASSGHEFVDYFSRTVPAGQSEEACVDLLLPRPGKQQFKIDFSFSAPNSPYDSPFMFGFSQEIEFDVVEGRAGQTCRVAVDPRALENISSWLGLSK